jgi:hypothetical protein
MLTELLTNIETIVASAAALAATITAVTLRVKRYLATKSLGQGIDATWVLHQILHDIVANSNSDRAIVCRIHNGGHRIEPSNQLKITVLHEWASASVTPLADKFQARQIDSGIIDLVSTMRKHGRVRSIIGLGKNQSEKASSKTLIGISKNLLPTSILEDFFQAEGMNQLDSWYLGVHVKQQALYLLILSSKQLSDDNPSTRTLMRSAISELRRLLDLTDDTN